MAVVVFETFDQILVDGVAAGNIVDVISNHAPRRAEVLAAFNIFRDSLLARQDEELSAQNTELKEQKAELESEKLTLTSQVSTLTSEKSALTSQVATLTSQVESLTEQKATLITEKSELVASHAEEKSELFLNHLAEKAELVATHNVEKVALTETHTTEKATLNAALAAANARIVHLTNELPFNPREISLAGFMARLKQVLDSTEMIVLFAADTPDLILKQIATTITGWESKYPIRLDSQELQQPLGYLVSIEMLTPEEVVFLQKDCTRAEAYFAPEEE